MVAGRHNLYTLLLSHLLLSTILLSPYSASAQPVSMGISMGAGLMDGDTTYEIGGRGYDPVFGHTQYRFPISKLKFPMQVYMSWVKGHISFFDRLMIQGHCKYSLSDDAGKLEDSDWGINIDTINNWKDPDSLDIFSLSNASLHAMIFDSSVRLKLYANKDDVKYWLGVGFMHQKLDYQVSDLDEWYPSLNDATGQEQEHTYVEGLVLTYRVSYNIPYVEFAISAKLKPELNLEARMGFSPFVNGLDRDNHILRNKISYGKADGHAYIFNVDTRYTFWRNVYFAVQLDLLGVYTKGNQDQYLNQNFLTTIETKIVSQQMYAGLAVGGIF